MVEKFEKFTVEKATLDLGIGEISDVLGSLRPVILDTNFLFVSFQFNIDIISEMKRLVGGNFDLFIYEGTIGELKSVERKGDKNKKYLPLIMKMLHLYNVKIIKSEEKYIDDQILSNLDTKVVIATNDKELRLKIQSLGYKVIYLRQRSYLAMN